MAAAALFARVQRAQFYTDMTSAALALLDPVPGQTLLDAGCGPGLLARQAQGLGYSALGADSDAFMVATARIHALGRPGLRYVHASAQQLARSGARFDVVAAASLLAVSDDRAAMLANLWELTAPGGNLLVIEPTASMTAASASALRAARELGPGAAMLSHWARAREGRTVEPALFERLPAAARWDADLVGGLVRATRIARAP